MADRHIVIVAIDHAPHDDDQDPDVIVYEFRGPDAANRFHKMALAMAQESDTPITVYPIQPLSYFEDEWAAFGDLGVRLAGGL